MFVPKSIKYCNKTDAEFKAAVRKFEIMTKKAGELITLDRMKKSIDDGLILRQHMAKEDKFDLDSMGNFNK